MIAKLRDLRRKELVNVKDGTKIGYADDIIIDADTAEVKSLIVYGRLKLLGLLGRQPDITISWENIKIIGEDAILITIDDLSEEISKKYNWKNIFRE